MSLTNITCGVCGIAFCLPTPMYEARKEDGRAFFCPNGHHVSYSPSAQEREIAALKKEIRSANEVIEYWREGFDEQRAAVENLVGALKECPGGCGWRSKRQIPRDPIHMGRGIERVKRDVAEHLVREHGAGRAIAEVRQLEAGS